MAEHKMLLGIVLAVMRASAHRERADRCIVNTRIAPS